MNFVDIKCFKMYLKRNFFISYVVYVCVCFLNIYDWICINTYLKVN